MAYDKTMLEIAALPEFRKLPEEVKAYVRDKYFDNIVAPTIKDASTADMADAKATFTKQHDFGNAEPEVVGLMGNKKFLDGSKEERRAAIEKIYDTKVGPNDSLLSEDARERRKRKFIAENTLVEGDKAGWGDAILGLVKNVPQKAYSALLDAGQFMSYGGEPVEIQDDEGNTITYSPQLPERDYLIREGNGYQARTNRNADESKADSELYSAEFGHLKNDYIDPVGAEQSIGYTVAGIGTSAAMLLVPGAGTVGATVGVNATLGAADANNYLRDVVEKADRDKFARTKQHLTPTEQNQIVREFEDAALKHGLIEGGTELVSDALTGGVMKFVPGGKTFGKKIGKAALGLGLEYAGENAGETAAGVLQNPLEVKAGIANPLPEGVEGVKQAFKDQFGTTNLMFGLGKGPLVGTAAMRKARGGDFFKFEDDGSNAPNAPEAGTTATTSPENPYQHQDLIAPAGKNEEPSQSTNPNSPFNTKPAAPKQSGGEVDILAQPGEEVSSVQVYSSSEQEPVAEPAPASAIPTETPTGPAGLGLVGAQPMQSMPESPSVAPDAVQPQEIAPQAMQPQAAMPTQEEQQAAADIQMLQEYAQLADAVGTDREKRQVAGMLETVQNGGVLPDNMRAQLQQGYADLEQRTRATGVNRPIPQDTGTDESLLRRAKAYAQQTGNRELLGRVNGILNGPKRNGRYNMSQKSRNELRSYLDSQLGKSSPEQAEQNAKLKEQSRLVRDFKNRNRKDKQAMAKARQLEKKLGNGELLTPQELRDITGRRPSNMGAVANEPVQTAERLEADATVADTTAQRAEELRQQRAEKGSQLADVLRARMADKVQNRNAVANVKMPRVREEVEPNQQTSKQYPQVTRDDGSEDAMLKRLIDLAKVGKDRETLNYARNLLARPKRGGARTITPAERRAIKAETERLEAATGRRNMSNDEMAKRKSQASQAKLVEKFKRDVKQKDRAAYATALEMEDRLENGGELTEREYADLHRKYGKGMEYASPNPRATSGPEVAEPTVEEVRSEAKPAEVKAEAKVEETAFDQAQHDKDYELYNSVLERLDIVNTVGDSGSGYAKNVAEKTLEEEHPVAKGFWQKRDAIEDKFDDRNPVQLTDSERKYLADLDKALNEFFDKHIKVEDGEEVFVEGESQKSTKEERDREYKLLTHGFSTTDRYSDSNKAWQAFGDYRRQFFGYWPIDPNGKRLTDAQRKKLESLLAEAKKEEEAIKAGAAQEAKSYTSDDVRRTLPQAQVKPALGIMSAYRNIAKTGNLDAFRAQYPELSDVLSYDAKKNDGSNVTITGDIKDADFIKDVAAKVKAFHDEVVLGIKPAGKPMKQSSKGRVLGNTTLHNRQYFVNLFEHANLSTLAHESSHVFFLEFADIVHSGAATEQMIKDWNTLCDYVGAERNATELTEEQNEKLARAFETYLAEGKAPTAGLKGVFERFKNWMLSVYRDVVGTGTQPSQAVRDVFGRMLSEGPIRERTREETAERDRVREEMIDAVNSSPKASLEAKKLAGSVEDYVDAVMQLHDRFAAYEEQADGRSLLDYYRRVHLGERVTEIASQEVADHPLPEKGDLSVTPSTMLSLNQWQNLEDRDNKPGWYTKTAEWMRENGRTEDEIQKYLDGVKGQMMIFESLGGKIEAVVQGANQAKRGKNRTSATDENGVERDYSFTTEGPIRSNADPIYVVSFDASSQCVKRLNAANTALAVEREIGRPLNGDEQITLVAVCRSQGKEAPCLYCYVESGRNKARDFLNTALDVAFEDKPIPTKWKADPKQMAKEAIAYIKKNGITRDDIHYEYLLDSTVGQTAEAQKEQEMHKPVYDLMKFCLNAAKSNKVKPYEEYKGEFLNMTKDQVELINGFAGFRFFSSSDFQVEHVIDVMQALWDLNTIGGKAHGYTKVPLTVHTFGDTGLKWNMSCFAKMTPDGDIAPNVAQGWDWKEAQEFRKTHPDCGVVMVTANDKVLKWAMSQDWIDYCIPFHMSAMQSQHYGTLGYQDSTGTQLEDNIYADTDEELANGFHEKTQTSIGNPERAAIKEQFGDDKKGASVEYVRRCIKLGIIPIKKEFVFSDIMNDPDMKLNKKRAAAKNRCADMIDEGTFNPDDINPELIDLIQDSSSKEGKYGQPPRPHIRMHEMGTQEGISNAEGTRRYLKICFDRKIYPVFPAFMFKNTEVIDLARKPGETKDKFEERMKKARSKQTKDAKARWKQMVMDGKIDWSQIDDNFFKVKKDYARTDTPFNVVDPTKIHTEEAFKELKKTLKMGLEEKYKGDPEVARDLIKLIKWSEKNPTKPLGQLALKAMRSEQDIVSAITGEKARETNYAKTDPIGLKPIGEIRASLADNIENASSIEDVRRQYEGKPGWMKAPNGKPTKLSERQWLQVRTPEFKSWFGDWENNPNNASKVVDKNGEPMVVYHGTPYGKFDTFKSEDSGSDWFAQEKEYARTYSDRDVWVDEENEDGEYVDWDPGNPHIFDTFLNIRNPIDLTGISLNEEGYDDGAIKRLSDVTGISSDRLREIQEQSDGDDYLWMITKSKEFADEIRSRGYDGMKAIEGDGKDYVTWGTLDPNQIKSSSENSGAFSTESDNIYASMKGSNKGITSAAVKSAIAPVQKQTGLQTEVVQSFADLPQEVQDRFSGDTTRLEGVNVRGTVYLVAGNIKSPERAAQVWMHEHVGHGGFETLMSSKEKEQLTNRLFNLLGGIKGTSPSMREIKRLAIKYGQNLNTAQGRDTVMREYLANLAEKENLNEQERKVWRRLWNHIAATLRKAWHKLTGNNVALAEDEIRDILRAMKQNVMDGERARKADLASKIMAQIAWHGTPHKFDRFTLDHIGEGEGNQAHGWGLYFAKDRKTAQGYMDALSEDMTVTLNGKEINIDRGLPWGKDEAERLVANRLVYDEDDNDIFKKFTADEVRKAIDDTIDYVNEELGYANAAKRKQIESALRHLETMKSSPAGFEYESKRPGQLYQVDIPNEDVMLDEQKLYSEQPDSVKEALKSLIMVGKSKQIVDDISDRYGKRAGQKVEQLILNGIDPENEELDDLYTGLYNNGVTDDELDAISEHVKSLYDEGGYHRTTSGREIYLALSKLYGGDKGASIALNQAGIEGITYDGRRDGRCFVVFDDKSVDVLEKVYASMEAFDEQDKAYLDAVERGDIDTARKMVEEKAAKLGFKDAIPEQMPSYKVRTGAAPKKTIKVYKTFFVDKQGRPSALFVNGNSNLPQNVWLDATDAWHFTAKNGKQYVPSMKNPNRTKGGKTGQAIVIPNDDVRKYLLEHGFIDPTKNAEKVTALAYRPGWHAGQLPFFPQGGTKNGAHNYDNAHSWNQVVFECEMAFDKDYTKSATIKSGEHKGKTRYTDMQEMPMDGGYRFATNPMTNAEDLGTWFISGALKINRALTQEECDTMLQKNGYLPQEWEQGKMNLEDLGYTGEEYDAAKKTLAPVTYDDNGNIIPLSQRFDPSVDDIRDSIAEAGGPAAQRELDFDKAVETATSKAESEGTLKGIATNAKLFWNTRKERVSRSGAMDKDDVGTLAMFRQGFWLGRKNKAIKAMMDAQAEREDSRQAMTQEFTENFKKAYESLSEKGHEYLRNITIQLDRATMDDPVTGEKGDSPIQLDNAQFNMVDYIDDETGKVHYNKQGEVIQIPDSLNDAHYEELREKLKAQADGSKITDKKAFDEAVDAYIEQRRAYDQMALSYMQHLRGMKAPHNIIDAIRQSMKVRPFYFPHQRFGNWAVIARDKDGNTLERIHFDAATKFSADYQAGQYIKALREQYPDAEVWHEEIKRTPEDAFDTGAKGVDVMRIINDALDKTGKGDTEEAEKFRKELARSAAQIFLARGIGQRQMHRQTNYIAGFETDNLMKTMVMHASGLAGAVTKYKAAHDFTGIMGQYLKDKEAGSEKNRSFKWMKAFAQDMLRNSDDIDKVIDRAKSSMYLWYLGANIKSGMVNLTQNPTIGLPIMSADMGTGRATIEYFNGSRKAILAILSGKKDGTVKGMTPEEDKFLNEFWNSKAMRDTYAKELRGMAGTTKSRYMQKVMDIIGAPMEYSERFNRLSFGLSTFRAALDGKITNKQTCEEFGMTPGKPWTYEAAVQYTQSRTRMAHGGFGKGERAQLFRHGDAGRVLNVGATFKSIQFNNIELWKAMLTDMGPEGKKAFALSMAAHMVFGGAVAVPFLGTFAPIAASALSELFGGDDDPERYLKKQLGDASGKTAYDVIMYGTPAMAGVTIKGSLETSMPLSDLDLSKGWTKGMTEALMKGVFGAGYSMLEKPERAFKAASHGRYRQAAEYILPSALANISKAERIYREGDYTSSGRPIPEKAGDKTAAKFTAGQAALQAMGFASVRKAKDWDKKAVGEYKNDQRKEKQSDLVDRYIEASAKKDRAAINRIVTEWKDWNSKHSDKLQIKPIPKLAEQKVKRQSKPL